MDEMSMKAIQGLYEKRERCTVAKRVSVQVDGAGKAIAYAPGPPPTECDTSQGCNYFWICPGEQVTFRAEAFPGWNFDYWDLKGNPISTEPKFTIQMYKGTMTAHFSKG